MPKRNPLLILSMLFLVTACALPGTDPSSGPTVEPPVPASGTILFQDDFSNPLSGWDLADTANGVMNYDGGVFRFLVHTPNSIFWTASGTQYTDTRVEVDTAKFGGPDVNRAGLICRWNKEQFYLFMISSDGYFGVGRGRIVGEQSSGSQKVEITLLGQEQLAYSANIRTGMAVNHLRADCAGTTLTFYINGFPAAQVNDPELKSGEVGLLAGAFEQGGVDVIFDKFIVMQP
jgi:hypothetical protein